MPYQNPGLEMQTRVNALITAVNNALAAHYKTSKTKPAEQISISLATGKGAIARTPEEQAQFVLKGTSWTCNSAHMSDAAKHVLVKQGGILTWNLNNLATKQKDAWSVLTKAWNAAMTAQDIRNYQGGKNFAYPSADPLHMELPDARLPENDLRVVKCLEAYVKGTRLDGKAKNTVFEDTKGSAFQKDWIKAYDAKLAGKGGKK